MQQQQQESTCWAIGSPFLLTKKAGALGRATLNGPFYNSGTSSEHVFVSVLTQGAGEVTAKPISLAQQCRVIKDGNYSPVSSVKARALSDRLPLLSESTSMQVLRAEEPAALCYGFCSLNALSNSSRWAGLQAPELGPWQSCLTGPQAALIAGRWPLALGVPVSTAEATHSRAYTLGLAC